MLPVLFKIGNFPVHTWGLLLMAGFLAATWYAAKRALRYGIKSEDVWDIALIGLFGGIIGARLAWMGQNLSFLTAHPEKLFAIWEGGMTSFGGFFGGILAGAIACYVKKVRVADMADAAGIAFPIGYGLGRVGCFLNGCCYGDICNLPWAVNFKWDDGIVRPSHPAQLYSVIASILMFLMLRPIEKNRKFPGQVMLSFLILYGLYRFLIEFVRAGATAEVTGLASLTTAQVFCLIQIVVSAILYAVLSRRPLSQPAVPSATVTPGP